MKLTEQAASLIQHGEIQEASTNLLEDTVSAILGDPISIGKIMLAVTRSPFFIREQIFWMKLDAFLDGVYLSEQDLGKLRAKLVKDGGKQDNPLRLVESIDRAETRQKIQYLINATRCLLADFIDRPTYFRICNLITHTLEEDLQFLKAHIKESDLPYSTYVQGLLTAGLMYQSVLDGDGAQKYSFTPVAEILDRFALSYDEINRYPDPRIVPSQADAPKIKIPSLVVGEFTASDQVATDQEVSQMIDEVFDNVFNP